jgi:Flp pilus assembly protein TadD
LAHLPERRELRWKLVQLLVEQEDWDRAEVELLILRDSDPTDGLPYLQLGLVAYRRGDHDRAFRLMAEAQQRGADPLLVTAWRMRIFFADGQADSARVHATALTRLSPESEEAWRIRSLSEAEDNALVEALVSITQWAQLRPRDPEPLLLGAAICREKGLWEEGLAMIRAAARRAPQANDVQLEYAAFVESINRLAEAEEVLQGILGRDPHHAEALNFLGYMWVDRGRNLEEAQQLIRGALQRQPNNPAFLDSMGWLWYKRGDLKRAETWLERATAAGGRHPEIYQHLAQVKREQGKVAEAREILEQGLELNPGDLSLQRFLLSLKGVTR